VASRRPERLSTWHYRGKHQYFVTFCVRRRLEAFISPGAVECVREQIVRTCTERAFAVPAIVFLPEHVHFLAVGLEAGSHFTSCMTLVRQRSGHAYRQAFGASLWQDGYFERVLRNPEDAYDVIRYIADNPVRAGLCARPEDYAYCWLERDRT
jgi:putative transposase